MIYFVRAGEDGPVKIGYAFLVPNRFDKLQQGHYEELHLLRQMPGERRQEAWLHKHFQKIRVRGEWYVFVPEMLAIEVPDLSYTAPRVWRSEGLEKAIADAGGVGAYARKLRVSHQTVSNLHEVPRNPMGHP